MSAIEKLYLAAPPALQTLMLNGKALELYVERYGRKFDQYDLQFQSHESQNESEILHYQNAKLDALITHAFSFVPYYMKLSRTLKLTSSDINCVEDLQKLPVLTKDIVKAQFSDFISTNMPKWKIKKGNTSGTTGSPLNIRYDIDTCVVHHVADRRQKRWAGMQKGESYASIQGRLICPIEQDKPPFWRKNYVNNQHFLSSFHLKKQHLQLYIDYIAEQDIQYLEGYPSTVYALAAFLDSTDQILPLKAVLTSSETLYEWQRATIEKRFDCKVFDFYGMAERVVFATECEAHCGRHLNLDYGITEFLDSSNNPVAAGQEGDIIATSLHNLAFPLIRYKTNDRGTLLDGACSCGRSFPVLAPITTKSEATITLPDGRWVSPSVLTHPFKPMKNIVSSQIIQEDLFNITLNIVKNDEYGPADEALLARGFEERIGEDVKIHFNYVNEIASLRSGKFKWVESRIVPKFD